VADVIGVVGAGTMGNGIAQVAARAGYDVILHDVRDEFIQRGLAAVDKSLQRDVDKSRLSADEKQGIVGRIRSTTDLGAFSEASFVIEAVVENLPIKIDVFKSLDHITPPETILASNTSSISITKLGAATRRPDKVIGMHFMNPVPLMKLVEIVRGLPTSDETATTVTDLAKKFGKTTIGARDIPGFIVNRMLIPLLNEACYGLYEGLGTASDIDTGVRLGLNHPMGPLELADLIGLDTCLAIAEVLHRELGDDKYRPCPLLRQYVAAGWLGRKTLRGFYEYDAQGQKKAAS
jgi:3-hydroxybutyryl-CoA dehydrogenase